MCLPNKSSSSVIDRLTKRDHHWKRWRKSTNLRFDFVCHESFFHTLAIKLSFYFVIIYFYFSQLKNDYTTKFKTKNEVTQANITNVFEFFTKVLWNQQKEIYDDMHFQFCYRLPILSYLNQIQISKNCLWSMSMLQ